MNVLERFFEYKILYCYDIFDNVRKWNEKDDLIEQFEIFCFNYKL